MGYKYVFWDWNGTLFDDAKAACKAVNLMLDKRALPNITFEQYREFVDVPIIRFYEKVMDVSKENFRDISLEFNSLWEMNLPENPIAAGALQILSMLKESGVKQYIFSSSHNNLIIPFLKKYGLEQFFEKILGATDCYVGSKAERTLAYIENENLKKSEILFVGDMVHDSDVASFVGADCVLVSCGHQCVSALEQSGKRVVSSLFELQNFLSVSRGT